MIRCLLSGEHTSDHQVTLLSLSGRRQVLTRVQQLSGMLTTSSSVYLGQASTRSLRSLALLQHKIQPSSHQNKRSTTQVSAMGQQPLLHGDTFFLDNFALRQVGHLWACLHAVFSGVSTTTA
jgi:hypothetical protein